MTLRTRTQLSADRDERPRTARVRAPEAHGYLDGVDDGHVFGWCCRPSDLATRLEVEVVVDGRPVGRMIADLAREKVAEAGFGDGRYGFRYALPEALADGRSHRLAARVDGIPLRPSPAFVGTAANGIGAELWSSTTFVPEADEVARSAEADADDEHVAPALRGYIDGFAGDEIVGWVVDEGDPETPIAVEAHVDGVYIGAMLADEEREDVERAGYGARHGFRFPLPSPPAPGRYSLEVRTAPDQWRVPLAGDYSVLDERRRPVAGITLTEPRVTGPAASSQALLGVDGWIFEWPSARVFHILRGEQSMPRPVLNRQRDRILGRRDAARAHGRALIEAVVPSKLAVYPDMLPPGLDVDDVRRPADELAAAIREVNGVELIDLTVPLRSARRHGAVCPRTGAGLTWLGGFAAYRVLAKELAKLRPELEPQQLAALELGELVPLTDTLADLPRLVWVGPDAVPAGPGADDEEREGQPSLNWRALAAEYAVVPPELADAAGGDAVLLRRREPGVGIRALVIHDGSASPLLPFLAGDCDATLVLRGDDGLEPVAELFAPDVIFEILSERSLLLV